MLLTSEESGPVGSNWNEMNWGKTGLLLPLIHKFHQIN